MAVSFVDFAIGASNSTTTFTLTLPATAAGDTIIVEFTHRGTTDGTWSGTYTGPSFQQKHKQLFATSTFSSQSWWSRATGNHSGETVIVSGLTNSCAAIVTIYRGAHETDPLGDATIVGEQNASGNETQAEITTATNGAWVVLIVGNSPDYAISSQSCTSPGTLIERAERLSTGGTDSSIAHASEEKSSAGATGAFTWAQTDSASGSYAYAIKPAPANHALTADPISTTPVVAHPALSQNHVFGSPAELKSTPALSVPALGQNHVVSANGLATGAPALGNPALSTQVNYSLIADPLAVGPPVLATPAITQVHAFTATGISAGPTLGTPSLSQGHVLSAKGIAAAPALGTPAVSQVHALTASGVVASPTLAHPAISQGHMLSASGLSATPALGHPALAEEGAGNHALTATPLLVGAPVLGNPALAQNHLLVSDDLTLGTPCLGNPAVSQPTAVMEIVSLTGYFHRSVNLSKQFSHDVELVGAMQRTVSVERKLN